MRPHPSPAFRLTAEIVAKHGGDQVLCLASQGVGKRWDLYPTRPGAEYVAAVEADGYGVAAPIVSAVEPLPSVLRVDIRGPIEETAGYADECDAWSDGNDAITERLCAAFEQGDVLLCVHSPGGNPSMAPDGMRRVLEAKAKNGRRCIGHVTGMAASLGFWWLSVVAHEGIFISPDARVGSIGARIGHGSIAGALAQEGVAFTFSAWPNEGKTALVPELPLSALGKSRNDRDAGLCGVSFATAVASSPLGIRTGLTVEALAALSADVLTGSAAVAAGLADGLATLEETAAWALESAGTGPGDTNMTIKAAEEEKPPKAGDGPPESTREPGMQPDPKCKSCGMENRAEAKFCDQCGGSMAAEPVEPKPEDAPESSKRPGAMAPRSPMARAAAAPMLSSVPALRASLSRAEKVLDAVASMVGARSHAEILGAVEATAKDASNAKRYREERNEARGKAEARERMDLLASLFTQDPKGHPRGKLVLDVVENLDAHGNVIPATDKTTPATRTRIARTVPAAQWSDGPTGRTIANLRAYTRTTLAGLTAAEANPYDKRPAEADEKAVAERVTAAHVEAASGSRAVMIARDDGIDPKVAAEVYARRFGPAAALPPGGSP